MKNLKKYLIIYLLSFIFVFISSVLAAEAQIQIRFSPQVPIPGDSDFSSDGVTLTSDAGTEWIARYIGAFYRYGVSIGAILAAVVLMAAGLLWLTSGGSQQKIGKAKELITGSIVGLFLLFGSYMILNLINPALVNLRVDEIKPIAGYDPGPLGCCTIRDLRLRKSIESGLITPGPERYWNKPGETNTGMVHARTCYDLHVLTEGDNARTWNDTSKTLEEHMLDINISNSNLFNKNLVSNGGGHCRAKSLAIAAISKLDESGY